MLDEGFCLYLSSESQYSIAVAENLHGQCGSDNSDSMLAKKTVALHLGNVEDANSGFKELLTLLNKNDDYKLSSANAIYVEKTSVIIQAYIEACKMWYFSEPQKADFINNPEGSVKQINDWVEGKTGGKIRNLLPRNSVDSLTRLIVVNTLYFVGNWSKRFPKQNTKNASFTLINMEKKLSHEKLADWTNSGKMKKKPLKVFLPRFQLDQGFSVKEVLTKLGISDAFDQSKASFLGISQLPLYVSDVVQKTFMKVDEDGTEAAASTAAVVGTFSLGPSESFAVDRSFFYAIQNKKSKCVLFFGKYLSP
ncbi:serpin B10-like [Rhinophrynus dorsalis]